MTQDFQRAERICRKIQLDRQAQHALLADMERRAKERGWFKRTVLLWALHQLVGYWVNHPKFHTA